MIDFTKYRQEQENAEKDYEQQLRRKPVEELTTDELNYLQELNESFTGTTVDKSAMTRYNTICELAAVFLEKNSFAERVRSRPPKAPDPHGYVFFDFGTCAVTHGDDKAIFDKMAALSDEICIASGKDGALRVTFTVYDVLS